MLNIKRMFNYLVFVLLVLISFSSHVNAMTFYANKYICYNKKFEYASCQDSGVNVTYLKYYGNNHQAYCGNEYYSFHGGTTSSSTYTYRRDKDWSDARNCKYLVYNAGKKIYNTKNDGDCSTILGYVIQKSQEIVDNNSSDEKKFMTTQGAVWTYLGAFAPSPYNEKNASNWTSNKNIKNAIKNAFRAYRTQKNVADAHKEVDEGNMINISNTNPKLYYIPTNDNCGKGYYRSDNITITNNCSHCNKVKVTITSYTDKVKLYKPGEDEGKRSIEFDLSSNGGKKSSTFYLKSSSSINKKKYFRISASYEDEKENIVKISVPDTYRYLDDTDSENKKYQSMFILKTSKVNADQTVTTEYSYDKRFGISFNEVGHNKCSPNANNSGNNGGNTTYKCMNNASEEVSPASFNACACKVQTINGKKIGIIVSERVEFLYGTFSPSSVYPGGGFAFSDSTTGQPTYYSSVVNWDFSDYSVDRHGNKLPYYAYVKNGKVEVADANALMDNVHTKLKDKLETSSITLNISTKDSNNSRFDDDRSPYNDYKIKFNVTLEDKGKKFICKNDAIKMNEAIFKSDGSVSYRPSNDSTPLDKISTSGGNKYYVPTDYMNGFKVQGSSNFANFPFNIINTNLSLMDFNFGYNANCYEKVLYYDLESNLGYRPVDEDDVFPNGDKPANWAEYENKYEDRIKNSFNSDKLLYSINVNDVNISELLKFNKPYTNWDDVTSKGVDNFVNTEWFIKKASSDSYCPIGKFDASCDK